MVHHRISQSEKKVTLDLQNGLGTIVASTGFTTSISVVKLMEAIMWFILKKSKNVTIEFYII